ncbi:hypothetical protein HN018_09405 [Lichenicola cladoniae]|uniref:Uncharacterized protein n=1 Tax=Lichenicola cladoniae TaxID=1484109 RepID=A0A6M8HPF4_9PROT|nr:transporter [Lichenicola cladoniae]NPD66557.1 hypothetical protein [Acetobacteraceae bacterium]QKE90232.1 hypothetical protein HN018_09405 [Lichenicola cladoniae]
MAYWEEDMVASTYRAGAAERMRRFRRSIDVPMRSRSPRGAFFAILFALAIQLPWATCAQARERGQGALYNPGVSIGLPTGMNPPEGFLATSSLNFYSADNTLAVPNSRAPSTSINVTSEAPRFFWTMPWKVFGATEMMWMAQPYVWLSVKSPSGTTKVSGFGNTLLEPINLSWNLHHHLHGSIELGVYVPDGDFPKGAAAHIGNDFYTFQQEASLTYLANSYSATAHFLYNTNTASAGTHYRSGDQAFLELYATKTFNRFSIGPVAYMSKQVTADNQFDKIVASASKPQQIAVGGIAAYNFGRVSLQVYVTQDVEARYGGSTGTRVWTRLAIPFSSHNRSATRYTAP